MAVFFLPSATLGGEPSLAATRRRHRRARVVDTAKGDRSSLPSLTPHAKGLAFSRQGAGLRPSRGLLPVDATPQRATAKIPRRRGRSSGGNSFPETFKSSHRI